MSDVGQNLPIVYTTYPETAYDNIRDGSCRQGSIFVVGVDGSNEIYQVFYLARGVFHLVLLVPLLDDIGQTQFAFVPGLSPIVVDRG